MSKRVYLVGPEVFLATSREIGARAGHLRPLRVGRYISGDEEHEPDPAFALPEQDIAISRAMEYAMRSCDAMIVDTDPVPWLFNLRPVEPPRCR
jgi:nucleoside 2-deoxyribosyltransferase